MNAARDNEERGALGKLQEKIESRGGKIPKRKRYELRRKSAGGRKDWERKPQRKKLPGIFSARERAPLMKKVFWGSAAFFLAALGISLFVFLGGANVVSSKNVDISIGGPVSIGAGEKLSLQIIIENGNNVPLEFTDLVVEYPDGTRHPEDLERELSRVRRALGEIGSGSIAKTLEEAVLFGHEGEQKVIHVALEYRIRDSNAIFVAEREYGVHISSAPVRLSLESLEEVNSGKEFEMKINVESNSNKIIHGLLVSVEYPFGFTWKSSFPEPLYGKNTWRIGDLEPESKRTITIGGVLEGQDGDEKIFRIEGGTPSGTDERVVGIPYASTIESIEIARPFLDVRLIVNGKDGEEHVANSRETVRVDLVWTNNLPTKLIDGHIEARLRGATLDRTSVNTSYGFYRSFDDTIIWDGGTFQDLREIESGDSGRVSFRFSSTELSTPDGEIYREPAIAIDVDARANRISETGVPQEIRSTARGVVKINSEVKIAGRAVYHVGPFVNTGPLPPRIEQETTYTAIWTLVNSANPVSGGVVTATLPPYVQWMGIASPLDEEVVYIEDSRTVRWNVGNVKRGTGIAELPREVAFQVVFLPSVSQAGDVVSILSPAVFTGFDQFTGAEVAATHRRITTELSTDPQFERGQGQVEKLGQ